MRVLGAIVAFILMFVLMAGEVGLHLFVGLQLYEVSNKLAATEFISKLTTVLNNSAFTEYSSYLLKQPIRILYYVLIFIVIALIFSFNSRFSTTLKEVGFATVIASLPFVLLSYGFFAVEKRFPLDSTEYFKQAFRTIFGNTSLWALAGGIILIIIGTIVKKISRKVKDSKKRRIKQQKKEERKENWKAKFARKQKTDDDQSPVEIENVEEEEN